MRSWIRAGVRLSGVSSEETHAGRENVDCSLRRVKGRVSPRVGEEDTLERQQALVDLAEGPDADPAVPVRRLLRLGGVEGRCGKFPGVIFCTGRRTRASRCFPAPSRSSSEVVRVTTLGIQTPAPSVERPAAEVGTARWMARELLLRIFCRLQNEAWYDVRRVHRTPWYIWILRDQTGRTLPFERGRPAPQPRRRGGGSRALLRRSMTVPGTLPGGPRRSRGPAP